MKRYLVLLILFLFISSPLLAHSGSIPISWDKNTEEDLAGYKIYYNINTPGEPYIGVGAKEGDSPIILPLAELFDPNNPEFVLSGLSDTTYYIAVTAIDTGNLESLYSNEVSATITNIIPPSPPRNCIIRELQHN